MRMCAIKIVKNLIIISKHTTNIEFFVLHILIKKT